MVLARSLWLKIAVTLLGAVGFFLIYQATMIDSRTVPGARTAGLVAGSQLRVVATAYCKGTTTATGAPARSGVVASDPDVLPLGSVIRIDGAPDRHDGIYTVLDTGPLVQGRRVDLYMWSCHEALEFGRRTVTVTVLRRGWRPNDLPEEDGRSLDAP